MPDPHEQPGPWVELVGRPGWRGLARLLLTPESEWAPREAPDRVNLLDPGAASILADTGAL
eukprot:7790804-Lingulodinium_polyedra.AAC.1